MITKLKRQIIECAKKLPVKELAKVITQLQKIELDYMFPKNKKTGKRDMRKSDG